MPMPSSAPSICFTQTCGGTPGNTSQHLISVQLSTVSYVLCLIVSLCLQTSWRSTSATAPRERWRPFDRRPRRRARPFMVCGRRTPRTFCSCASVGRVSSARFLGDICETKGTLAVVCSVGIYENNLVVDE